MDSRINGRNAAVRCASGLRRHLSVCGVGYDFRGVGTDCAGEHGLDAGENDVPGRAADVEAGELRGNLGFNLQGLGFPVAQLKTSVEGRASPPVQLTLQASTRLPPMPRNSGCPRSNAHLSSSSPPAAILPCAELPWTKTQRSSPNEVLGWLRLHSCPGPRLRRRHGIARHYTAPHSPCECRRTCPGARHPAPRQGTRRSTYPLSLSVRSRPSRRRASIPAMNSPPRRS